MIPNYQYIPLVSTFIPSLPEGMTFRISIHSWEMPSTSPLAQQMMAPGDSVVYEARLLVDGFIVA